MIAVLMTPSLVWAQDAYPPETSALDTALGFVGVKSVGFFVVDSLKAPGSVLLIDASTLEQSPARTMAQALDFLAPGFFISRSPSSGPLLGQRGIVITSNAKTVVMLDGQNINPRWDFGVTSPLDLPLLGDIERIEVVQGPGAILHGSGAINGFINMIGKNGRDHPGFEFRAEGGLPDRSGLGEVSYGLPYESLGGGDIYVYAGFVTAGGYQPNSQPWNAKFVDFPRTTSGRIAPSTKALVAWNRGDLTLKSQFVDAWTPAGIYARTSPSGWHQAYWASRLEYTAKLAPDHELSVAASALFNDTGPFDEASRRLNVGENVRESNYKGRLVYKTTAIPYNSLAAGFELGLRSFDYQQSWIQPTHLPVMNRALWSEYGFFAETMFNWDPLVVTLGARYDLIHYHGGYFLDPVNFGYDALSQGQSSQFSPRLAISYALLDDWVFKASYQHGFRAADAGGIQGNAGLRRNFIGFGSANSPSFTLPPSIISPESTDSLEASVYHKIKPWDMTVTVTGFYNFFNNYIFFDNGMRNVDDVFSGGGVEAATRWVSSEYLTIDISYAYAFPAALSMTTAAALQTTDLTGSSWRVYPPHQIKGLAAVHLLNGKLNLQGNVVFYSGVNSWPDSYTFSATNDPLASEKPYRRGVVKINASVTYDVIENLKARFVAQNLFHNGAPVLAPNPAFGRPDLTATGLDERLLYLQLAYAL